MKSRRLIASPEAEDKHRIGLNRHTERGRMSALGQKQTCAPQKAMSALPNEFFGEGDSTLWVTGCPTMVNLQIAAVHPP